MAAGFGSTAFFLVCTTIITSLRFFLLLRNWHLYKKYEKVKNFVNKFFWCLYNSLFLVLWVLNTKKELFYNETMEKAMKITSFCIVFCLLLGGLFEFCFIIIDIGNFMYESCLKIFKKNNQITPKKEVKARKQKQNLNNRINIEVL